MQAKPWVLIACILLTFVGRNTCIAAGPFSNPAALPALLPPVEKSLPVPPKPEPKRLVAATLAVTLGAFGAHRLYFGTDAKVPIIYGLTFGGFGVLVLIDLAHILFTKDLETYMNNDKVLMWSKGRTAAVTPP